MVTVAVEDAAVVVMVNVADAAPVGTVTVVGADAGPFVTETLTLMPPEAATPLIVTVACEIFPPTTLVGLSVSLVTCGAHTRRAPDAEPALVEALIDTLTFDLTGSVFTVNVAELAPAGMVTLVTAGAAAVPSLVARLTTVAFAAGPLSVTVAWVVPPPSRPLGLNVTPAGEAGPTFTVAVAEWPPAEAVIVMETAFVCGDVVIGNVVDVAPAGTVTLPGTASAAGALLVSVTGMPPCGAGTLMLTVPVAPLPPSTLDGFADTLLTLGDQTRRLPLAEPPGDDALIATVVLA